ncbi:MAG: aspartate carbamoyltransferase catalytic subunit [Oligoflexia bacterium]|nr:aspartate carbamoyltransferase catalytic subunit [Oligoflexia bacterium]
MKKFQQKHLLGTENLSKEELLDIIETAKKFKDLINKGHDRIATLEGKIVVLMFFEPSTRTRSSFEIAAKRLGASTIDFSSIKSSATKGETLIDTAKNLEAMQPDVFVIRHSNSGTPYLLSKIQNIPIINAGDGFHEHPSQALLDLMTILEHKPHIEKQKVLIVGDIAHSRVARSNIYSLKTMGADVAVCGPATMLPPEINKLGVKVYTELDKALPNYDVVMMLRIQAERGSINNQFPSLREYSRFWGLKDKSKPLMKPDVLIMHPGPMNRGVEISQSVADSERSVILPQVTNGVAIRMSLLHKVCNGKSIEEVI